MNNLGTVLLNYQTNQQLPDLSLLSEEYLETINHGYAETLFAPVGSDFFWLLFQNVDDHIDGNGISSFYLTQGNGIFYYNEQAIEVKQNDIVLFDDNIEHGFSSKEICIALNITWNKIPSNQELIKKIEEGITQLKMPVKKMTLF